MICQFHKKKVIVGPVSAVMPSSVTDKTVEGKGGIIQS